MSAWWTRPSFAGLETVPTLVWQVVRLVGKKVA